MRAQIGAKDARSGPAAKLGEWGNLARHDRRVARDQPRLARQLDRKTNPQRSSRTRSLVRRKCPLRDKETAPAAAESRHPRIDSPRPCQKNSRKHAHSATPLALKPSPRAPHERDASSNPTRRGPKTSRRLSGSKQPACNSTRAKNLFLDNHCTPGQSGQFNSTSSLPGCRTA